MRRGLLTTIGLCAIAVAGASVSDLSQSFAQESGHSVKATFGTMGVVRQKLGTDPADVVIGSGGSRPRLQRPLTATIDGHAPSRIEAVCES